MSISAATVTLAWDPSPEPSLSGYKLYSGTTSGVYTEVLELGNVVTATVSNLVGGTTYFFAATALDTNGLESAFSSEIPYTPPAPILRTLTVKTSAALLPPVLTISPLDRNGEGSGSAPIRRGYSNDTVVTITAPAMHDGRTFVKWVADGMPVTTNRTVTLTMNSDHNLAAMFVPSLRLTPRVRQQDHGVEFLLQSEDGTAIDPLRLARLEVMASDDLAQPLSTWIRVRGLLAITDDTVTLYTTEGTSHPRRFYILMEE